MSDKQAEVMNLSKRSHYTVYKYSVTSCESLLFQESLWKTLIFSIEINASLLWCTFLLRIKTT